MKRDITSSIERMPALEDRTGTRLEAIYGETEQHDGEQDVHVRGEIYAASGAELTESVDLVLTVYDDQGRVVATTNTWLNQETFFAFETFELSCFGMSANPQRIRLYPKFS